MDTVVKSTQDPVKTDPASIRSRVAWRDSILFCLLALLMSWAWWGVRFAPHVQSGQPILRSQLGPLDVQLGMAAPLLAALIMRLFISKEGLRNSIGIKRPWKVYLAAYCLPLLLGTAAFAISQAAGFATFAWTGDVLLTVAPTILLLSLPAVLTALGEEYGWRGYLLPRLLKAGDVTGTIIVGLIWGLWHLPLIVLGLIYPEQNMIVSILVYVCCTIMLSFFFTAFHHISAGSVAVAAVIHGAVNLLSEVSAPRYVMDGSPFVTNPLGISTTLLLFIAGAVMLMMRNSQKQVK